MKPFYVYMLRCADGSYYTGQTDDMAVRLRQHEDGEIGYTATRKPVELVWQGEFETREGSLAFEQQIKGWSRAKKEALMAGDWRQIQSLARSKSAHSAKHGLPPSVRPELVDGLRQAQPERMRERPERMGERPERIEELRQAQHELLGKIPSEPLADDLSASVRPELVEGLDLNAGLRQAQPERVEGNSTPSARSQFFRSAGPELSPSVHPEPSPSIHPELSLSVRPEPSPSVRPEPSPSVRPEFSLSVRPELVEGLLQGNATTQRRAIAKAITLLESTRTDHRAQGDELLTALLPRTGNSFRLGISGVPGVGKSTFIEVLGLYLIAQGHRVAVLTIDPSSTVSGGSILGDKTRMERLSVHERAYIRPSPSSGTLGGVAEKTREAMLVCEAAGYDVVIVETVGVGQSETAVANMTDMFVLMQLPNAGDDLQAIKKGVMELADLVVINKADIDADAAMRAEGQIKSAMRLFGLVNNAMGSEQAKTYDQHWHPQVLQLSALHNRGVDAFWNAVTQFKTLQTTNGQFAARRQQQSLAWMWERIDAGLKQAFRHDPAVGALLPSFVQQVASGQLPASTAARQLLAAHAR